MTNDSNVYAAPEAAVATAGETYQPKVFALSGRVGRLRYFAYSMIYNVVLYLLIGVIGVMFGVAGAQMDPNASGSMTAFAVLYIVFVVASLVLFCGLMRRRLNDLDKSGWLQLLFLIPVVNILLALYLLFAPGSKGENSFGPQPTENHPGLWIWVLLFPAMLGILAAVAIPAYQDYVQRAQAAQMEMYGQ